MWKPRFFRRPGTTFFTRKNPLPLRCFYLIMEPCRGGDLLERADDGVGKKWWMRGFIFGFIGCWTGCFRWVLDRVFSSVPAGLVQWILGLQHLLLAHRAQHGDDMSDSQAFSLLP